MTRSCARAGCRKDALLYATYVTADGRSACSMYCRDMHDVDIEFSAALATKDAEIERLIMQRDSFFVRDDRDRLTEAKAVIEDLLLFTVHAPVCPGGERCKCHKHKARAFLARKGTDAD